MTIKVTKHVLEPVPPPTTYTLEGLTEDHMMLIRGLVLSLSDSMNKKHIIVLKEDLVEATAEFVGKALYIDGPALRVAGQ